MTRARLPHTAHMQRWRRPDALELELSASLSSRNRGGDDEYGWQVWTGDVHAVWDLADVTADGEDGPLAPPSAAAFGWRSASPVTDGDEVRLLVGQLERWLLPLDFDDPGMLFEAADAITQDLAGVVAPIVGNEELFQPDCYELTEQEWFDHLLVLRSIELIPQLRGHNIGGWASARSVEALTRGPPYGRVGLTERVLFRSDCRSSLGRHRAPHVPRQ
jgi:hypothetical protein